VSTDDDLATVLKLYDAFAARDLPALTDLLHPEVTVSQAGDLPWSGRFTGHDGVVRFLTTLLAHVDSTLVPGEVFHTGEAVVQVGRTRGATRTAGTPFDVAEVHVLHVRDGLVDRFEALVDTDAFHAALG
jgi:ketosteroid isomerase-like protein